MKKYAAVFLSLLSLLTWMTSALAAREDGPALPDRGGPPSQSSFAPVENERIPELPPIEPIAPIGPEEGETGIGPLEPAEPIPAPPEEIGTGEPSNGEQIVRRNGRGTVDDLYAWWEENGYPADVAYAFEAGGELVGNTVYTWWEVGLVGNDPARQEEILSLAGPACLVEFKNALFSHGEKAAAYSRLLELAGTDENILRVVFTRNDDTVWVAVPEERAKEYAKYLIRDCGLGAVVSVTDSGSLDAICSENGVLNGITTPGGREDGPVPAPDTGGGLLPEAPAPAGLSPAMWAALIAAVGVAAACAALSLRGFRAPAAATARGEKQLGRRANLSRREVARAVKDSVQAPDGRLYRSILDRLGEKKDTDKL